jgi:hypothetical protein
MPSLSQAGNSALLPLLAGMIPLLFGWFLVASCLGNFRRPAGYLLILSLASGFGLAITSVLYFFWIYLYHPKFEIGRYAALEGILFALLVLIYIVFWIRVWRRSQTRKTKAEPAPFRFNFVWGITIAGVVTLFLATIVFLHQWQISAVEYPDGNWDAWAIWNLRARFIYAGELWRDGFNAAISWTHPDYPLLLPGSIARIWVMLGSRAQAVPLLINLSFLISILAMILAGITLIRGWKTTIFAGLFTIAVLQVSLQFMQYADMPLAFFILSANLLLFLSDVHITDLYLGDSAAKKSRWSIRQLWITQNHADLPTENQSIPRRTENHAVMLLVGVAAGAALWTKDEGWAFLVALVLSEILRITLIPHRFQDLLKRWGTFLIGFTPLMVATLMYKSMVNIPANLLTAILHENIILKVVNLRRYQIIGITYLKQFFSYGSLKVPLLPLLVIYPLVVGIKIRKPERNGILALAVRVGTVFLIYTAIYLLTPSSLEWHLNTSLTRLMSQLLPSIILIAFICSRSIEEFERKNPEIIPANPQESV